MTPILRPGQHKDETAVEYLHRVSSNLDMEHGISELPSVEACLEYFELWHTYDTDFLSGVFECIENGESAKPYNDFVKKWGLDWNLRHEIVEKKAGKHCAACGFLEPDPQEECPVAR